MFSKRIKRFLDIRKKKRVKKKISTFLFLLIRCLQKCRSQTAYLLLDNLYEPSAGCIDTYSLFLHMRDVEKMDVYYVIWKENPFYAKLKSQNQLKRIIPINYKALHSAELLFKIFFILPKLRVVVDSFHGSLFPALRRFLYDSKYIHLVGIGHGPVFLKNLVFITSNCVPISYNYYNVTGPREMEMFLANGWEPSRLLQNPLPRFTWLKKRATKPKQIFIMFTWRTTFGGRAAEEFHETAYYQRIVSLLYNKKLAHSLKQHNIKIIFSAHHALKDLQNKEFNFLEKFGFAFELADSNNLINHINEADLLVTDYSSIFWDFMFLETPMIFYRPDHLSAGLNRLDLLDHISAGQKDQELYNVFYSEDDTVEKIIFYIENNFSLEEVYREKTSKMLFHSNNILEDFVHDLQNIPDNA